MARKTNYWYVMVFTNGGPVYVTDINYKDKVAQWDCEKAPLEMTREAARDLCMGLSANGSYCVVVNSFYEVVHQPYRYEAFDFTFKRREEGEKNED